MPLATIEIEQVAADRWVARLETGSTTSRRAIYQAASLAAVMAEAESGYWELSGAKKPAALAPAPPPVPSVTRDRLPPLRDGVRR